MTDLSRVKNWTGGLVVGGVLAIALIGTVLADNTALDSDGVVPFASNNTLAFGERCVGATYPASVLVAAQRNGSYPNPQVWENGAPLTVSATETSAEISMAVLDGSIVLPANWQDLANNTLASDIGTASVSLTPSALGPQSVTVSLSAAGEGSSAGTNTTTRTQNLTVTWTGIDCAPANTAPQVAYATPPTTADEGDTKTFNFTITDPDAGDTFTFVAGYPDCGTGGDLVGGSASIDSVAKTGTFQCSFPDGPAAPLVAVKVQDAADAESNTASQSVIVANVSPSAALANNGPVDEGSAVTVSFSSPSDPSAPDTAAGFHYAYSCTSGDLSGATYAGSGTADSTSCTFTDDGTFTVKGRIIDKDGGFSEYTTDVTVSNVAPVLSLSVTPDLLAVNNAVTATGTFTDAGTDDTHSCTVDWDGAPGDETQSLIQGAGSGTCAVIKTMTAAGVYKVTMTVTDDDGASDTESFEYVVVYDPSAGFVTGGGWVNVAAGSYLPDASLVGKGTFGFVSKYQKGATTPTGNTEFQFHAAGMNFASSSYQWLVVSGAKAQFKGTGTLNGTSGYGFLLTATDGAVAGGGGVDQFRIKIWELAGGTVIFDNSLGASDDINAADPQAIGHGSIVIHAPKK